MAQLNIAGWSSSVARRAHNPKVVGSNPAPATTRLSLDAIRVQTLFFYPAEAARDGRHSDSFSLLG